MQMNEIDKPKTIIACGRRFTPRQLLTIQETVDMCKNLSCRELALTICEHLQWKTEGGKLKVNSCLKALEQFEKQGLIVLPEKQVRKIADRDIEWTNQTEQVRLREYSLDELCPLELRITKTKAQRKLWNEYIDRYHYLGYKQPFGAHLRYFIVSKGLDGQYLGCILFSSSAWSLASRDTWIGWSKEDKTKRLNLILNNSRFLIFPWISVQNLASKVLSQISRQVVEDWKKTYNYEPVLLETFVDTTKYTGTCYQSANWEYIGNTTGRGRMDRFNKNKGSIKKVFVYPLRSDFRSLLRNEYTSSDKKRDESPKVSIEDDHFVSFWEKIVHMVACVSSEFDEKWQKRKRIINTLLIILLIFRLLFSKNRQSYNITIAELWDNCHKMKLTLPQKTTIAASSFTEARKKLDEHIFKILNQRIISAYKEELHKHDVLNHRIFAVDGTKINLPRSLINEGFTIPTGGYYPQGLSSSLYHLESKIPFDFGLASHCNERICALEHLSHLTSKDIVIYDRGYFSYPLLYYHNKHDIDAIFRLKSNSYKVIDTFMHDDTLESMVTIHPDGDTKRYINKQYPEIDIIPLELRLLKYTINETPFYIGTTLFDSTYDISFFKDVYHSRWGIEELYKISKNLIEVEDFHAQNLRGVKQELFAHFLLVTINRIFSNHAQDTFPQGGIPDKTFQGKTDSQSVSLKSLFQTNFKHCLAVVSRSLEPLFIYHSNLIKHVIKHITLSIAKIKQRIRPNRTYKRFSMKPIKKWRSHKAKIAEQHATA
jgi:hypothetical protein